MKDQIIYTIYHRLTNNHMSSDGDPIEYDSLDEAIQRIRDDQASEYHYCQITCPNDDVTLMHTPTEYVITINYPRDNGKWESWTIMSVIGWLLPIVQVKK